MRSAGHTTMPAAAVLPTFSPGLESALFACLGAAEGSILVEATHWARLSPSPCRWLLCASICLSTTYMLVFAFLAWVNWEEYMRRQRVWRWSLYAMHVCVNHIIMSHYPLHSDGAPPAASPLILLCMRQLVMAILSLPLATSLLHCVATLPLHMYLDIRYLADYNLLQHSWLYLFRVRGIAIVLLPAAITLALQAGKPAGKGKLVAPSGVPTHHVPSGSSLSAVTAGAAAGLEAQGGYVNPLPLVPDAIYIHFHQLAEAIHARADPHTRNLMAYVASAIVMASLLAKLLVQLHTGEAVPVWQALLGIMCALAFGMCDTAHVRSMLHSRVTATEALLMEVLPKNVVDTLLATRMPRLDDSCAGVGVRPVRASGDGALRSPLLTPEGSGGYQELLAPPSRLLRTTSSLNPNSSSRALMGGSGTGQTFISPGTSPCTSHGHGTASVHEAAAQAAVAAASTALAAAGAAGRWLQAFPSKSRSTAAQPPASQHDPPATSHSDSGAALRTSLSEDMDVVGARALSSTAGHASRRAPAGGESPHAPGVQQGSKAEISGAVVVPRIVSLGTGPRSDPTHARAWVKPAALDVGAAGARVAPTASVTISSTVQPNAFVPASKPQVAAAEAFAAVDTHEARRARDRYKSDTGEEQEQGAPSPTDGAVRVRSLPPVLHASLPLSAQRAHPSNAALAGTANEAAALVAAEREAWYSNAFPSTGRGRPVRSARASSTGEQEGLLDPAARINAAGRGRGRLSDTGCGMQGAASAPPTVLVTPRGLGLDHTIHPSHARHVGREGEGMQMGSEEEEAHQQHMEALDTLHPLSSNVCEVLGQELTSPTGGLPPLWGRDGAAVGLPLELDFYEEAPCVSVAFVDVCGFTRMSHKVPPKAMVALMHELLVRLDNLTATRHTSVFKVDCIGDGVMLATNLTSPDPHHARSLVQFCKDLLHEATHISTPVDGSSLQLRAGIHSGPAASALLGLVHRKYSLWGDTVNVAARLENVGAPGAIHVSSDTFELLQADSLGLLGSWATTRVPDSHLGTGRPLPRRVSSCLHAAPPSASPIPAGRLSSTGTGHGGGVGKVCVLEPPGYHRPLQTQVADGGDGRLSTGRRVSHGLLRTVSLDPEGHQQQVLLPAPIIPDEMVGAAAPAAGGEGSLSGSTASVITGPGGVRYCEEEWVYCGRIEVRGKGVMHTYLLHVMGEAPHRSSVLALNT